MTINIAVLLAAVGAAGWLALQLYHVVSTVIAARQNKRYEKFGRSSGGVRLSVEAQTKLMHLDIRLGVLFGIGLLGLMIGIVGFLRTMIAGGS